MIVAQDGFVALGIAARVAPISAVRVRLSFAQGQTQSGVGVCIDASVVAITAVIMALSSAHGQSGPGQVGLALTDGVMVIRVGVASISIVALGAGVMVTNPRFEPQPVTKNKTGKIEINQM